MPSPTHLQPGFKSDAQRENFLEASRDHQRGGPLARNCGVILRDGTPCRRLPPKSEARCRVHGGPHAARRFRTRQIEGLRTGRVSPEEFARAEARRARNALLDRWKVDPTQAGATIDFGANEWRFVEAAQRRDVDVLTLLPAIADWLRWRWQRLQIDRQDDRAWMRTCREDLPRRASKAHAVAQWVALGRYRRAGRAGPVLASALKRDGFEAAQRLVSEWRTQGINPPPKQRPWKPLTPLPVRPWTPNTPQAGSKRLQPDNLPRERPKPMKGVKHLPDLTPEQAGEVLREAGPAAIAMYQNVVSPLEQRRFIATLYLIQQEDAPAEVWSEWLELVRRYRNH